MIKKKKYQHIQLNHSSTLFPLILYSVVVCRIDLVANELQEIQDSPEVKLGTNEKGNMVTLMKLSHSCVVLWNILSETFQLFLSFGNIDSISICVNTSESTTAAYISF